MEELEAVDWYQQRVDATKGRGAQGHPRSQRDEEIEHAMMVLRWIRRRNPTFDANAKTYLFSKGNITEVEAPRRVETPAASRLRRDCDEVCTARRWLARHRQPKR